MYINFEYIAKSVKNIHTFCFTIYFNLIIMKRIIIVTACILFALVHTYAQDLEIKGNNNTYLIYKAQGIYDVCNKSNILLNTQPNYLINNEVIPEITVENIDKLTPLVIKYIAPYFKNYSGTFKSNETVHIAFYSDMDGNIKEISLVYPDKIGIIPGTVMEAFECEVLKSGVRLGFDKNRAEFRGSTYVTQYKAYSAQKLQKGYY